MKFKSPHYLIVSTVFLLILVFSITARTQWYFENNFTVFNSGVQLKHPWAGGINFPVFSSVDLDGDGMEDLFVFDRSNDRAMTFIRTGPGPNSFRYAPEYAAQLPELRGWALLYDYNCDGKADLFTTSVNNNGILQFRNDSQPGSLLFTAVDSVMKADYGGGNFSSIFASAFLMPHLNDVDGDGDMDVLGQQFFCVGTFAYYKNMSMENYGVCDSLSKYVLETYSWGKFSLRSGAFQHVAVGQFHINCLSNMEAEMNSYQIAQRDDTFAGIFTIDIDGDGDKDALIGDSQAINSLLVINGGTPQLADMVSQDTLFPSNTTPVNVRSFVTHAYQDVDFDGVKDLLVGHNENENKRGVLYYRNAGSTQLPVFSFKTDNFLVSEMIDVGEGAAPVFFDENSDGLPDILIGNVFATLPGGVMRKSLTLLRNIGSHSSPSFEIITEDYAGVSSLNISGPLFPAFADLDGDGDQDMLLGAEDGTLYHFTNTAGPSAPCNFVFTGSNYSSIDVGSSSAPQFFDLNQDGLPDLLIGEKNGFINYFENTGTLSSPVFSSQPTIDTLGGIVTQTPGFVDGFSVPFAFRDSAQTRIAVANMAGDVVLFGNIDGNINGFFTVEDTLIKRSLGVRTRQNISVSGGDINGDLKTDLLFGLYGGGIQIHIKGSPPTGIKELGRNKKFVVYPNPVAEYVMVKSLGQAENDKHSMRLSDMKGILLIEKMISASEEKIELGGLMPGVYMLEINNKYGREVHRLIKYN
ncbi:MAG: T9SS C-terminal target domain-containing protein [Bacteroidetes bacterium]|nr:MAG: T9SS C-terminal target domain-containing protein [Bacteroidota bacterium]